MYWPGVADFFRDVEASLNASENIGEKTETVDNKGRESHFSEILFSLNLMIRKNSERGDGGKSRQRLNIYIYIAHI